MQRIKSLWARMSGLQQKVSVGATALLVGVLGSAGVAGAQTLPTTTVTTPDLVTGATTQFGDAAGTVTAFLYTALPIALVIAIATYIVYRVIGWIGGRRH